MEDSFVIEGRKNHNIPSSFTVNYMTKCFGCPPPSSLFGGGWIGGRALALGAGTYRKPTTAVKALRCCDAGAVTGILFGEEQDMDRGVG